MPRTKLPIKDACRGKCLGKVTSTALLNHEHMNTKTAVDLKQLRWKGTPLLGSSQELAERLF